MKKTILGIEVEAIRWTEENLRAVIDFAGESACGTSGKGRTEAISIATPNGVRDMHIGDWLCKLPSGETYVVHACEVCGEPASAWVRDTVTRPDPKGNLWKVTKPNGPGRCFCPKHERAPRDIYVPLDLNEVLHIGED